MTDLAISADSHVVEPKELFVGLEEQFGSRAPQVRWDDQRGDLLQIPGVQGDAGVGSIVPIGRLGIAGQRLDDPTTQEQMRQGYAGIPRAISDPTERLKAQDADGVGCEVLFPSLYFRVFGSHDVEMQTAAFQSYNDYLADYCSASPNRLIGLALIPTQDPVAGAAELDRAIQRGFRGVCFPCIAPAGHPYHDAVYDPLWARAEEAGLPINFHIFTGAEQGANDLQAAGPVASYASAAVQIQITAADLICQGVAHRFPKLNFVLAEWEAGWIAQWLERLDHAFYRARFSTPPELDLTPREYWRRQFFATFEDDRYGVLTREGIGIESLLWANDYPHHDSIWPHSQEVLSDIMRDVPDDERRAILVDNAAKLYRVADY